MAQLERRIHFLRILWEDTSTPPVARKAGEFPLDRFWQAIRAMPYDRRTVPDEHGIVWAHAGDKPGRLFIARTRHNSIPQRAAADVLADFDLSDGEGMADLAHAVIFADGHIGFESNFFAPGISALGKLMTQAGVNAGLVRRVHLARVVRGNLDEVLASFQGFRTLELAIDPAQIPDGENDLFQALRPVARAGGGGARKVSIMISVGHSKKDLLSRSLESAVEALRKNDKFMDNATVFRVGGVNEDGRTHPIDLLAHTINEKVVLSTSSPTSRNASHKDTWTVIESTYRAVAEELRTAHSMQ